MGRKEPNQTDKMNHQSEFYIISQECSPQCLLPKLYKLASAWDFHSNNIVCATTKAYDQPAHMRSLIRVFACRSNILWVLS